LRILRVQRRAHARVHAHPASNRPYRLVHPAAEGAALQRAALRCNGLRWAATGCAALRRTGLGCNRCCVANMLRCVAKCCVACSRTASAFARSSCSSRRSSSRTCASASCCICARHTASRYSAVLGGGARLHGSAPTCTLPLPSPVPLATSPRRVAARAWCMTPLTISSSRCHAPSVCDRWPRRNITDSSRMRMSCTEARHACMRCRMRRTEGAWREGREAREEKRQRGRSEQTM
jgi:hypothetical protein